MTRRFALALLPLVLALGLGCGSQPQAPVMTDELRTEIEEHDAMVEQLESQQTQ